MTPESGLVGQFASELPLLCGSRRGAVLNFRFADYPTGAPDSELDRLACNLGVLQSCQPRLHLRPRRSRVTERLVVTACR